MPIFPDLSRLFQFCSITILFIGQLSIIINNSIREILKLLSNIMYFFFSYLVFCISFFFSSLFAVLNWSLRFLNPMHHVKKTSHAKSLFLPFILYIIDKNTCSILSIRHPFHMFVLLGMSTIIVVLSIFQIYTC